MYFDWSDFFRMFITLIGVGILTLGITGCAIANVGLGFVVVFVGIICISVGFAIW